MAHVKPGRQNEILTAMKGYKDCSVAFARSLILKTPPPLRATRKGPGATALEQCVREVTVPPRALLTLRLRSGQATRGAEKVSGRFSWPRRRFRQNLRMGRPPRITEPGLAYQVLNRRVMRLPLFLKDDDDYLAFECVRAESLSRPDASAGTRLINVWPGRGSDV